MSEQTGLIVPPGHSPPFATVTPDDHTAWILIATALGLACYLFFGAIRVVVRVTISHGFDVDDYVLGVATLFAVIQSSIVLGACSKGLGKSVDLVSPEAQEDVQKMYYTSNLFWVIVIGLSKISVICFLSRISRMRQHRLVFNTAMGLIAAWTLGSLLAIALQCDKGSPWIMVGEDCSGTNRRWQVISILDIISEAAIVALVVFLVYTLQTSLSSKLTVVAIFSFRLLIIIFVAFRLHTFDQDGYTTDPFLLEAPFIAWSQSQITYSLISATIPTFQNFLKNLNTGFGGIGSAAAAYGYGYASGSGSANRTRGGRQESNMSFQMSKLRSANKSVGLEEPDEDPERELGHKTSKSSDAIHGVTNGTTMGPWSGATKDSANNGETTSIASDESRRMMIRKEVQWSVRTEPRQ